MRFSNFHPIVGLSVILALVATGAGEEQAAPGPASLDLDTCGCPTVFSPPVYQVTEDNNETILGSGLMVLSNSGEWNGLVTSVILTLERVAPQKSGDAPGPGGKNWQVLATAVANRAGPLDAARSCYGEFFTSPGSALLLLQDGSEIAIQNLDPIPPNCGQRRRWFN